MKIIYTNEDIVNSSKSIFLAGPVPRDINIKSWRSDAIKYLEKYNFDGVVYTPECRTFDNIENNKSYMEWDKASIDASTLILMWIPRNMKDMPALTTNIEFGMYLHSNKLLYGRPDNSEFHEYLDWLYEKELGLTPFNDLEEQVKEAVKKLSL